MLNSLTYNLGFKNDTDYSFIAKHTLAKRKELSNKYNVSSQVVIICEAHRLYKKQQQPGQVIPMYIFSKNDPVTSIFIALESKLKIDQKNTLYLLCNNQLLQKEQTIGNIYEKYKSQEDGILYVKYCPQESFGN